MTLRETIESVLDTVKSLFEQDPTTHRSESEGDVGVTVEREADEEPEPPSSPAAEAETETDEAEADAGGTDESTDALEGIGPTYAERLADAGIETVADLAAADAGELAPKIDNVGESRIEDWIQRAKDR